MIIKHGMTINIRSKEELEVFLKIAEQEGYKWRNGREIQRHDLDSPRAISVGYQKRDVYPNSLSHQSIESPCGLATNIVEASRLFHNQLISKQLNK